MRRTRLQRFWASIALVASAVAVMAFSGCGSAKSAATGAKNISATSSTLPTHESKGGTFAEEEGKIRIGYQKYGTLNILKADGGLEKKLNERGVKVEWTEFPGGPQLLEALNAGSIKASNRLDRLNRRKRAVKAVENGLLGSFANLSKLRFSTFCRGNEALMGANQVTV